MPTTYTPLFTTTLTSATPSVTFSSIPQTGYTDLVLVADYATSVAGAQTIFYYNGVVTGTPYSTTEIYGTGSSAASYRFTNQNQIWFSSGVGSGSTLGQTNAIINIMNYANTTTNKTAIYRQNSNSGTYPGTVAGVGLWRSTNAINSVTIKADTGSTNFVIGSTFSLYGIAATSALAKATGGIITADNNYIYHTFTSSDTFTPLQSINADILVVAGGGGSQNTGAGGGPSGGGGAGGLLAFTGQSLTAQAYSVTIGAGSNSTGGDSRFGTLTLVKGGGVGGGTDFQGGTGGSGGGSGGRFTSAGGSATSGQGNAGGKGAIQASLSAGGGGGAGAVGADAPPAGNGGVGSASYSSWGLATGTGQLVSGTYYYAGGGAGQSWYSGTNGTPGFGGGGTAGTSSGNGGAGGNGTINTGGGGGGGNLGSTGGSGIVIVRYAR